MSTDLPYVDQALATRLERVEGLSNARFVEARSALDPGVGACWRRLAGAIALFDGPKSFCTQAFGLGLGERPTDEDLLELEQFFHSRGAACTLEICPLAGARLLGRLGDRGYRVVEISSVLYRSIQRYAPAAPAAEVRVREIEPGEDELWIDVAAEGWSDKPGAPEFIRSAGPVLTSRRGAHLFLAEIECRPIAAAALGVHDGTALLAGASTIPGFRGRGAQRALLDARLAAASESGCDLAMLVTPTGGPSQRNGERSGFRIAYTRTQWSLAEPSQAQ